MKEYIKLISACLFAGLLLISCQKSITETMVIKKPNEESVSKLPDGSLKNQCQLTYYIDWGGYPNWVSYNNKGLADEWRVEFGPDVYTMNMQYNNYNKLANAEIDYNGTKIATIEFIWTGNHITVEHVDYSGYLFDYINTYNLKGQLIIREGSDGVWRTNYEYTPEGNHMRDIVYFMNEPIQSDYYTYNEPNKNPFLAIQGLPYQFLYINPIQSKWFATSDKFTIYDYEGNPFVVLDIDPSKTIMKKTDQNYLSSATYYDNLSGEYLYKNFEYMNCGSDNNASAKSTNSFAPAYSPASKKLFNKLPLLIGKPSDRKKQIEELRKQYLNKR